MFSMLRVHMQIAGEVTDVEATDADENHLNILKLGWMFASVVSAFMIWVPRTIMGIFLVPRGDISIN